MTTEDMIRDALASNIDLLTAEAPVWDGDGDPSDPLERLAAVDLTAYVGFPADGRPPHVAYVRLMLAVGGPGVYADWDGGDMVTVGAAYGSDAVQESIRLTELADDLHAVLEDYWDEVDAAITHNRRGLR